MSRLFNLAFLLFIITGCSFKIPPGKYTTAPPPESGIFAFGGQNLTLTENGRFQYKHWSDDSAPTIGHGGYVVVGNYLMLVFENADIPESRYILQEIECTKQDSQVVNFLLRKPSGEPIPFVSIYNKDDSSQGTMTLMDGEGQVTMLKSSEKKVFIPHHMFLEDMEIKFAGDKCFDIEITIRDETEHLQLGHAKAIKLKREGEQLYIKMPIWKDFDKIYLREN